MFVYALVVEGVVLEVIQPATYSENFYSEDGTLVNKKGDEIPIEERFHPDFVKNLIKVTPATGTPEQGDIFEGGVFYPRPEPEGPSQEELESIFLAQKAVNISKATEQIAILQDAIDLDEAEEGDEAKLLAWKKYRVAVNKLIFPADFPKSPDET